MIEVNLNNSTRENKSQQSPNELSLIDEQLAQAQEDPFEWEPEDRKYDHKMFQAALAFYGLPPKWAWTFTKHLMTDKQTSTPIIDEKTGKHKTTLRSCNPSKACAQGKAVWTQINVPREGTAIIKGTNERGSYSYPKKAMNQEIAIIRNVALDFEYPPDPQKAHAVARKLVAYLASIGLCEPGHPIEDTGAGAHIALPIEPIECASPEIS